MAHLRLAYLMAIFLGVVQAASAQIPRPDDAPLPLDPRESAERFAVPDGFRVELVASEPLVREPSGVCWDERGQMFVCELHGYNLEGQYDIEELNKSGQLDRVVRRVQADQRHKEAAAAETYGTIKRLRDSDADGRIDRADVWADRLPPCLGICPARGGIIAACQTQILFLADRDGDGRAEVREVLFEGFAEGPLERSINCPQWGPDNWIYFGRGAGGGTIRGQYLDAPVQLPHTDFRIRADGSAIEPVVGGTHTMGFSFTDEGDRFIVSTRTPAIFVAPLPWRYLARNPDVAAGSLEHPATSDQRVYPSSRPHPWRTRRAADPGFSKYYSDRYGIEESAPNGYFTSACSPLVYRDVALPGLRGHLLTCEPAQNLIYRGIVERDGARLTIERAAAEKRTEFLTSSDPWFHAIAMSIAPDGTIVISDFYREIIEDYSAIPRYLQQQYGLVHGREHGRIWRLTHEHVKAAPPADMSQLAAEQLAAEVASPHLWRRTTAQRLLVERQHADIAPRLDAIARSHAEPSAVLTALHTLDGLGRLRPALVASLLTHSAPGVRRAALRFAERWLDTDSEMRSEVLALTADDEPMVRLQVALSLGQSHDSHATTALARLARSHGDEPWMHLAILTAVPDRGGELLAELLSEPATLSRATGLLEPLCAAIASRHHDDEMSQTLVRIAELDDRALQVPCLRGLRSSLARPTDLELSAAARESVKQLAFGPDATVQGEAMPLITLLNLETAAERLSRLAEAAKQLEDVQTAVEAKLSAVAALAAEDDPEILPTLLASLPSSTPRVRAAILDAIFSRQDRLPGLLDAVEAETVAPSLLSAVQRATLLEADDRQIRQRAAALLRATGGVSDELFQPYVDALREPRDAAHGQQVFREKCASCHQAHGIGFAVGPDLSAEFQRAEETIIRDVLAPTDTISPGYVTYSVATISGQVWSGLLAAESPTSITLRQAEGKEQTVLRKEIEQLRAMSVSMMPDELAQTVAPRDLANLLAWLRRPPTSLVLVDDNPGIVDSLDEGAGTAEFTTTDAHSGRGSLRITPPQRYSPRIGGWEFRIREHPGPGEYRYLRFAWKLAGGETSEQAAAGKPAGRGVMLELAADGAWPAADQPVRRYHAGQNTSGWRSLEISPSPPAEWTVVTRDLWREFGEFTLTGIAPTAMGGAVLFDRIEILQNDEPRP